MYPLVERRGLQVADERLPDGRALLDAGALSTVGPWRGRASWRARGSLPRVRAGRPRKWGGPSWRVPGRGRRSRARKKEQGWAGSYAAGRTNNRRLDHTLTKFCAGEVGGEGARNGNWEGQWGPELERVSPTGGVQRHMLGRGASRNRVPKGWDPEAGGGGWWGRGFSGESPWLSEHCRAQARPWMRRQQGGEGRGPSGWERLAVRTGRWGIS